MKDTRITKETAILAHSKGFDWVTNSAVEAVRVEQSLLQKWLYDKHGLWCNVIQDMDIQNGSYFAGWVTNNGVEVVYSTTSNNPYVCLEEILTEALKLI